MATTEHVDYLTTVSKAKGFLGSEFLTWLWYLADTTPSRLEATLEGRTVEFDLWIDDRLVLESKVANLHSTAMKGGDPSHSREAGVALALGKAVRELKLGMSIEGYGEYTALLGADDLSPRSLKLPTPERGAEAAVGGDLPIAVRLRRMDAFLSVLDQLFARFAALRTADDYESKTIAAMRVWIKKRQQTEDSATLH